MRRRATSALRCRPRNSSPTTRGCSKRRPMAPKISFTKEIIFNLLLPPLIFEAAFYLRWDQLRRELPVILTLASAGVALSGATVAVGMHYLAGWEWPSALVFGCLIAATDHVSVIATFSEAKVHGRLRLLIETESLFNRSEEHT